MLTLAQIGLKLAFASSLLAIVAFLYGHSQGPRQGAGSTRVGYLASYATAAFYTLCVGILTWAFFAADFSFDYVATQMSYDVSPIAWLYKIAGVWASREGSLLFWTWLITLFNAWMAYRRQKVSDPLSNMGIMVSNVVISLFGAAMIFSSFNDPFKQTPAMFLDAAGNLIGAATAWGMNPLLQHWAMTAHPPTLFVGYAGMTIPFAFAVAAMIVKDGSKLWVEIVNRVTVFAWVFLGIGIGLGSVWAYVVLGWGGYWAWDPVENASLLPWLTGVGLLHSFTMYRRRGAFKTWAIIMACMSFSMVILGTFITRSGVIQSVHAFASDPVSLYLFLTMIIAPIVILVWGLNQNKQTFAADDAFESLTSRESAYYFNNVIMLVASVLIAYLTLSQSFPSWMPFGGKIVAPEAYDAVARPIGIAYIAIIALCPLLSWGKGVGAAFWKKMTGPLIAAAGIFALLVVEWWVNLYPNYVETMAHGGANAGKLASGGHPIYYNGIAILGLAVAAITLSTTVYMFLQGVRARMRSKDESVFQALGFILFRTRTQSGGYLAHIGMAIILIGLVGSNMYVLDHNERVLLQPGAEFAAANYNFTFTEAFEETKPNGNEIRGVTFDVARDGAFVNKAHPSMEVFARGGSGAPQRHVYVIVEPLRDIFVAATNIDYNNGFVDLNVKINPLISMAWVGFGLLTVGSALAMIPNKRDEPTPVVARAGKKK